MPAGGAGVGATQTLEERAQGGDPQAQLLLAQTLEAQGQHELARGWYGRLFQGGDPSGLRLLAISLLTRPPLNPGQGVAMIKSAAEAGDAEAQFLCAGLAAQDDGLNARWSIALSYLNAAANSGLAAAQQELALVGRDLPHLLAQRPFDIVSRDPRILVCREFASSAECDWLIEAARPRAAAAQLYDPKTGAGFQAEAIRNNSAAPFGVLDTGVLLSALRTRLRASVELRGHEFEPLMVLHYRTGQQFAPHFDFIDPDEPGLGRDIAEKGQRVATFLIYLNADFTGGQTAFPRLDYEFKGGKGDAVLFWNVDAQDRADRRMLHAGMPPLTGEKWLLSQWIRRRLP